MLKKFPVFLSGCLLFLLLTSKVSAKEVFQTDVNVDYVVEETGTTLVDYNITIKNTSSDLYATSYVIRLENIKPENIRAYEGNEELLVSEIKENDAVLLRINFKRAVAGEGKTKSFNLKFEDASIASKTGQVWEIYVPRLHPNNAFSTYSASLSVPNIVGKEAYIIPEPAKKESLEDTTLYFFDKEKISKGGIKAGFGTFQIFSFNIDYSLENSSNRDVVKEVAIPPDTSIQKLYYETIEPSPQNIIADADGNWIVQYQLGPREKKNIKVAGNAQIFASPRHLLTPSPGYLLDNTKPTYYWQSETQSIKTLANSYSSPKEIYDFVVKTLKYDHERVTPDIERRGANWSLENSNNATCMEFTDLFISIARAAGVPAREINGFSYTENPEIQPLSLVADVLHSWPEYWDGDNSVWVSVDPTWGSTTGGVDYFSELDLRHFAFVIHGRDDSNPEPPGSYKLGANPQKSIFVNFSQTTPKSNEEIEIKLAKQKFTSAFSKTYIIEIINSGNVGVYGLKSDLFFDDKIIESYSINSIPPYGKVLKEVTVNFGLFGTKAPNSVLLATHGQSLEIPTESNKVVILQVIIVLLLCMVALVAVFFRNHILRYLRHLKG